MKDIRNDYVLYREYPVRNNPICISKTGRIYQDGLFSKKHLYIDEIPKDILENILEKLNHWQNDLTCDQEATRQDVEEKLEKWKKPKSLRRRDIA